MNRTDKVEYIGKYISRAEEIICENNQSAADSFCDEVIAVFSSEIEDITYQLEAYSYSDKETDHVKDVRLLKAKLENYQNNISSGYYRELSKSGGNTYLNQDTHVNQQMSVNVSFETVILSISNLPNDILDADEKESLQAKLAIIEADKKSGKTRTDIWPKVKAVLSFLADKSADAAIAALPYIVSTLQNL